MTMCYTNDAVLSRSEFWDAAFGRDVPFVESYRTTFRKGIVDANTSLIDLHREAIYYLTDESLWPIIFRLLKIALDHPEASFVESLSHFLSLPEQRVRLLQQQSSISPDDRKSLHGLLSAISTRLVGLRDEHLRAGFDSFASVLT